MTALGTNSRDTARPPRYIEFTGIIFSQEVFLDLVRIHVLPPGSGSAFVSRLIVTSPATRIVRSHTASPWEVFLRPDMAARISIHYRQPGGGKRKS
jgi:hypothetical protein